MKVLKSLQNMSSPASGERPFGNRILVDTQAYNIALSASLKEGKVVDAEKLFRSIGERDIYSYNTMLNIYATAIRGDNIDGSTMREYNDRMWEIYQELGASGLKGDKVTYTTLIKGVLGAGDIDRGLEIFRTDLRPSEVDTFSYNTLIRELCQRGRSREAKNLFDEMESKRISPDALTYSFIMNAMLNAKRYPEVIRLFERCREMGIPLSRQLYVASERRAGYV